MDVKRFYRDQISENSKLLGVNKKRRGWLLLAKLAAFLSLVITGYYSIYELSIIYPLLSLIIYLVALYVDSALEQKATLLKELVRGYTDELEYLEGDLSAFDSGDRYASGEHPYSLDLDLFGEESLFKEVCRCASPLGSDTLAGYLLTPSLDAQTIRDRQQAIEELVQRREWMQYFMAEGKIHPLENYRKESVDNWIASSYFRVDKIKVGIYILNGLTITSLLLAIFTPLSYGFSIALTTIQMMTSLLYTGRITKIGGELDGVIRQLSNYFYLIGRVGELDVESKLLTQLKHRLFDGGQSVESFKELKNIQSRFDQRSNVILFVLLNSLYMQDLHTAIKLSSWRKRYAENIHRWVDVTSEIDALVSMANYRFNHPEYIYPVPDGRYIISSKELAHPLMRGDVVANDFEVDSQHKFFVVTGANMSGKSTFLRSVGLNMVLALSGLVVRAESFHFTPIDLFSSMRTTDNLSKGTSYFHAELLRLKAMHDMASSGRPLFIIVDEMLKGTNSVDKLNGSLRFLVKLLELNISGIVATHDLALGDLATTHPHNFSNICFEIEHSKDDIVYTYKLQDGVSKNMNATFLLEKMNLV